MIVKVAPNGTQMVVGTIEAASPNANSPASPQPQTSPRPTLLNGQVNKDFCTERHLVMNF